MAEMGGLGGVGQARDPDEATGRRDLVRDKGRAGRRAPADRNPGRARWPCRGGPPPCPGGPEPGPRPVLDCRGTADRPRRPADRRALARAAGRRRLGKHGHRGSTDGRRCQRRAQRVEAGVVRRRTAAASPPLALPAIVTIPSRGSPGPGPRRPPPPCWPR